MRILVASLAGVLCLGGCATAPTVVREGSLGAALRGQSLATLAEKSRPASGAVPGVIEAEVLRRLAAKGADVSGSKPPAYLLLVGVGVSAPTVGISNAAGARFEDTAWRSAPTKRQLWNRGGPAQTVTAVVIDVSTGKPAAWATVRSRRSEAAVAAEQLATALTLTAP